MASPLPIERLSSGLRVNAATDDVPGSGSSEGPGATGRWPATWLPVGRVTELAAANRKLAAGGPGARVGHGRGAVRPIVHLIGVVACEALRQLPSDEASRRARRVKSGSSPASKLA